MSKSVFNMIQFGTVLLCVGTRMIIMQTIQVYVSHFTLRH